jgi:hypothetical protein
MGEEGMKTRKTFNEVSVDRGWTWKDMNDLRREGWDACLDNANPDEPEGVAGRVKLNMTAEEARDVLENRNIRTLLKEIQSTATIQPASYEEILDAIAEAIGRSTGPSIDKLLECILPLTVARSEGFEVDWKTAPKEADAWECGFVTGPGWTTHAPDIHIPRPVAKMRPVNREEMIVALADAVEPTTGKLIFLYAKLAAYSDATLLDLCKNTAGIAIEVPV